jgi:hypothetical protein
MQFVGGPYDGMEIDHSLLNRYAKIQSVKGDLGGRVFVLMPPRSSWDALQRGEPAEAGTPYPYEWLFDPEGPHFEYSSPGDLEQALLEAKLKVHSRAHTALAALSDSERRAVIGTAAGLQQSPPSSWPRDQVVHLGEDKPVYLLKVSPELRAFIRLTDTGQLELFDIAREDTLRLFLERYRAGSGVG